jgi:DNA polymerase III subunit gamma/tau
MPSYLVLARKYRPATFSDVVGQDHVIQTLTNSIASGRVAHAFLFCGVRGVGKTTVARIFAKALNCTDLEEGGGNPCNKCSSCREIAEGISVDVQEIDGASHTSVENIREINENIKYPPVSSNYKIIIIDEVHMISINAFNALLKTLEEPPPHAKFMFATTESHKVPATINSRCQRFNFRTVSIRDMTEGMARILEQEGVEATDEALALVAQEAQGSFRDALSLLDQVISFSSERITEREVTEILGIAGRDSFGRLVGMVLDRDASSALGLLHQLFRQGYDPEQFVLDLIRFLRNLIVVKTVPAGSRPEGMVDATQAQFEEMEGLARQASVEDLQNLFAMLTRGEGEIKRAGNPWVALEMTVIRMAYSPQIKDLADIVRRIESHPNPQAGSSARTQPSPSPPAARQEPKKPPDDSRPTEERTKKAVPPALSVSKDDVPTGERFVIEEVRPVPTGTPDEIWAELKTKVERSAIDPSLPSIMEHGSLISVGPTEIEVGFTRAIYAEQLQEKLQEKEAVRETFEQVFGKVKIKTLTLAKETSLQTTPPYSAPADGETDRKRALKHEAMDSPVTRAILDEFEGSSVEDIKIL